MNERAPDFRQELFADNNLRIYRASVLRNESIIIFAKSQYVCALLREIRTRDFFIFVSGRSSVRTWTTPYQISHKHYQTTHYLALSKSA